jgi:transposase-like protein
MGLTPELLRGLNLPQFEDAETARRYIEDQAWPDGPICAHCGKQERVGALKGRQGIYWCGDCRTQFSVTVKTVFHRTHVPLHKWLQVTAVLEKTPAIVREIAEAVGVAYKTAWKMRRIIRPDIKYGNVTGPRSALCYPFISATAAKRPDHELLLMINDAVPRTIPEDRRADICQELAIAILIGDEDVANLKTAWMKMSRKVYALHPTIYAPLSLDAPIPGTDGLLRIETISNEDSIWNHI